MRESRQIALLMLICLGFAVACSGEETRWRSETEEQGTTVFQLLGDGVPGAPLVPVVEVFCGIPNTPNWHIAVGWAYAIHEGPTKSVVVSWDSDGQVTTLPSQPWEVFSDEQLSIVSPPLAWEGRAAFFDRLRAGDTLTIQMTHDFRTRETFDTAGFEKIFDPVEDTCAA